MITDSYKAYFPLNPIKFLCRPPPKEMVHIVVHYGKFFFFLHAQLFLHGINDDLIYTLAFFFGSLPQLFC
ncbi:MAG: hypothetical protein AUK23_04860 [Deltaproteobacteria bacterium CG2_30_43_15]|nr:MAG: hypothetical protein AUK23_04860 [Deltaproteobacteria bacterium CG2_30_43_15]